MISRTLLAIQLAIGLVLVVASAGKWRDPMGFARGVTDYEVLPNRLSVVFGLLLIPFETWLAFSHLIGWWISLAAPLGLAMFASFAVAVGINLSRGRSLPCYCFGEGSGETISTQALSRLLLLLGGEGLLLVGQRHLGTNRLVFQQLASLEDLGSELFWTVLLVVFCMWILALPDLRQLLQVHLSLAKHERELGPVLAKDQ